MSHNPNIVKSQDDTAEDELGRTMTLLRAIEQLEKTEYRLEKVKKQLEIAKKYLNERADKDKYADWVLLKIEELNK